MITIKSYFHEGKEYFYINCKEPRAVFEMGSKSSNTNARLLNIDLAEFCKILEKCGAVCKINLNGTNYHTFNNKEDAEIAITMLKMMCD